MRIAVDVDGVLADIMPVWIQVYNRKYGATISPEQVSTWDFYDTIGIIRAEFFKIFSEAWSKWPHIKATEENLPEKLTMYRNLGQVDIVTGRSKETLSSVKSWLKLKGIPYDRFVAVSPRSSKAALKYDLYVDDAPKLAIAAAEMRKYVLLYDQPWNRGVNDNEYVTRIRNLTEGYEKAKTLKEKSRGSSLEGFR